MSECDIHRVDESNTLPISNASVHVDSGSVYVGVASPSRDAAVATRSGHGDGMLVDGVPSSTNVKNFTHTSSSGRSHSRAAPRSEDDDLASAPGCRERAFVGGYNSSVQPPNEKHARASGLTVSGMFRSCSKEISCIR